MRRSRPAFLVLGLLVVGCGGGRERLDPADLVSARPQPSGGEDGGVPIDVEPTPCGDFCGETFLREVVTPPNLYFVIDRSGSMGGLVKGSSRTKLQTARV